MHVAGPARTIRPRPAVFDVHLSTQRVEVHLPSRWRDVQGFPCLQIDPGGHDVNVDSAARLVVPHRGPGIAIRIQSGPGQAFKLVQHFVNLLRGRVVRRRPGNDAGSPPVFEVERVDNLAHSERIAAQHFNVFSQPALVILVAFEVLGGSPARCAGLVKFNHHA